MTRVVYVVGEEKITSYAKAKARANETGLTMKTIYEPIIEQCAVDPNLVARRMKAIREKAQQRKSHQALFICRAAHVPRAAIFLLYHTAANLSSKMQKKIAQIRIPKFVQFVC